MEDLVRDAKEGDHFVFHCMYLFVVGFVGVDFGNQFPGMDLKLRMKTAQNQTVMMKVWIKILVDMHTLKRRV